MDIQITVQVSADVAASLHPGGQPAAKSQELLQTVEDLGVALVPVHPGASDPYLAPYFTIEVPDTETAERTIERLRQSTAVEAAYIKPRDAMP